MLYFKFIDNQPVVNLIKRQKRLNEILLNLVIIYAAQEKVRQRSVWTLKHTSSFWEIDCQNNGENFFKTNFRMSRRSFDKLCVYLKNMEKSNTNWRNAIPLEKRVAIGLYALGSSAEYRTIGNTFGVGKATVCKILIEFCVAVWKIMGAKYLNTLPFTKEYIMENVAAFEKMGFPQCFGAIDGCHIEIHPKKVEAINYYNYKGWYSVVLFALVDAKYRFAYVSCGSPGRCNDSTIFENSNLKRTLEECVYLDQLSWQYKSTNIPVTVLGDSAFRLSKHVMKPYPHTLNNSSAQKAFNYRLSKCRRVVENAFGHLKARFRRIGKGVDNHLQNVNFIVNSACVLHNFLIEEKDQIVDSWQIELMMKPYPFKTAQNPAEKIFNYHLSKCRRVVENAFGHLKARFRRIGKGVDNNIENATQVVMACCVLHNFLNEENDAISRSWLQAQEEHDATRQFPDNVTRIGDRESSAEEIRAGLSVHFQTLGREVDGDGEGDPAAYVAGEEVSPVVDGAGERGPDVDGAGESGAGEKGPKTYAAGAGDPAVDGAGESSSSYVPSGALPEASLS